MKLILLSTSKDFFGVIDVCVQIDGKKEYTFAMKSQYDIEQFCSLLPRKPGTALNYLKTNCIKDKRDG